MNSRERVQCVLEGRIPDRVPFNFWMDRDAMAEYDKLWGHDFRLTHYGADIVEAFVGLDWWSGLEKKAVNDAKTSWQIEPLVNSLEEALKLPLPDPTAPEVCADIINKRKTYPDKAIFALMLAPLDILLPLRLTENLYTDLYDYPDQVHALLKKIKPIIEEAAAQVCKQDIDVLYLAGDICGRDGALVSPRQLREFLFDYVSGVIDIAHSAGKKVFYHSDGLLDDVIDLYIEYGIDGCNPLEPRYNDSHKFVNQSKGKLILYGGIDNCNIMPNGSPADVREHIRNQFEILGKDGKLIFSSHDIPSSCPRENLDAMVDEILNCKY